MLVRPERSSDYEKIATVIHDAFGQEAEANLVERLRVEPGFDPDLALVAEDGDHIVGHILFSSAVVEGPDQRTPALALAPLAVRPHRQRQGIGDNLAREGLAVCRRKGHGLVIVLGDPAYYRRFGFTSADHAGITAPFTVPPGALQVLELRPDALQNVRGVVRYSAAFDSL